MDSGKGYTQVLVLKWYTSQSRNEQDEVIREEPLEIRIGQRGIDDKPKTISITMRTPGQDECLALGFLFTEGIIGHYTHIESIERPQARLPETSIPNVVDIWISNKVKLHWADLTRHFYTTSSCGVCGKSSIDMVTQQSVYLLPAGRPQIELKSILSGPKRLGTEQTLFSQTGGVHAAGLFDATGSLVASFEDVGRHNALDKLIGYAWKKGLLPLQNHMVVLSGRIGFELVQKSWMAGIPILAAVGAPSDLAIELAVTCDMTLLGFIREERCNVYHDSGRVQWSSDGQ
ncbi:MAG: formate dehydrogenase accessory sulfurtransferase FdhD [Saprospiraceae bacterium]|nr:formate dehydrogenase accessory sulfurtransferase FdhD [Saprospiraceae bacterium]